MCIDISKVICWFVGTLGTSYDLVPVIKAAHQLAKEGNQTVQFIISGDGDNYSKYCKMAKGLPNIVFTGWVDLPQIVYLMRIADIGLAAYAEGAFQGLPNKIFEYMCAGIPILSSLTGESEELLRLNQCGLIFEAGDVNSFLDKLLVLINNEELRRSM